MKKLMEYAYRITGSNPQQGMADSIIYSFFIQVSSVAILFFTNLLLARIMSTTEYGIYSFAFSFASLVSVVATCGFTMLLVREVASYKTTSGWNYVKGLLLISQRSVWVFSLLAACICFSVFFFFPGVIDQEEYATMVAITMFSIPMFSIILVNQSVLNGMHEIPLSQVAEKFVRPFVLLVIVLFYWYLFGMQLKLDALVFINLFSFAIALLLTYYFLYRRLFPKIRDVEPVNEKLAWKNSLVYFMLLMGVSMINTRIDIVMLGFMSNAKDVAVYNVSVKLSEFIAFAFYVVGFSLNPAITRLYKENNMQKLQHVVTKSIRIVFLAALPLTLLFVFAGDKVLQYWGDDYKEGYAALVILSINQLINVITGPVGGILVMTGHEKKVFICSAATATLNIILVSILVPLYGVEGAAIAAATSLIIWNITMVIMAKRYTNISCTLI